MFTQNPMHVAPFIRVTLGMVSGVVLGSVLTLVMAVL